MRIWQRASGDTTCGSCGELVKQDAPVLLIKLGTTRALRRCEACAGEPVNWEAVRAGVQPVQSEPVTWRPVSALAQRFDVKAAQCGIERD